MEEDVRPPQTERLGAGSESLVEPLQSQLSESRVSRKEDAATTNRQDAPGSPFSRLPRTVIEQ